MPGGKRWHQPVAVFLPRFGTSAGPGGWLAGSVAVSMLIFGAAWAAGA